MYNVGSFFRTGDGAGIERTDLCPASRPVRLIRGVAKTALGAEERVPWRGAEIPFDVIQN